MGKESIEPLPEAPPNLAGESTDSGSRYSITVSNASGYLCHIHMQSYFNCEPQTIFRIFTNPDNTGVFRDIVERGKRKVLELDPAGRKIVEVEQVGETRVLFKKRRFSTFLHVDEDGRDPDNLVTSFSLVRSDILSRFNGSWALRPIKSEDGASVVGTDAILEQDILPAGAPAFLKHVPILGPALRGICVRAVKRMVEDLDAVLARVEKGTPLDDILSPPRPVASHVLDFSDEDDADDNDGAGPAAAQQPPASSNGDHAAAVSRNEAGVGEATLHSKTEGSAGGGGGGHHGEDAQHGSQGFWDRGSWPSTGSAPRQGS